MTVDHVLTILAVTYLERSVEFYDAAFGWPKAVDVPGYVEYQLPAGNRLGLYLRESFAQNVGLSPSSVPPGQITSTEIYLESDEVMEAIERIERASARLLSPLKVRGWGDEAAYYADPDGNVLVLVRRGVSD